MTKPVDRPKKKPGRKPRGPNNHRIAPEGYAIISMDGGKEVLCDAEDLPALLQHRWCATGRAGKQQATTRAGHGAPAVKMSRMVLGITDPAIQADHINHDTMDNRRTNLRPATSGQNTYNRRKQKNNTTGAIGVVMFCGKFRAQIGRKEGNTRHQYFIGDFDTLEEAATARDKKAVELHGEFAVLNQGLMQTSSPESRQASGPPVSRQPK